MENYSENVCNEKLLLYHLEHGEESGNDFPNRCRFF